MKVCTFLSLTLLVPLSIAAQLRIGDRIRVIGGSDTVPTIGVLAALSADSLSVGTSQGPVTVAVRSIRTVEVSQGMGHAGKRGAAIGAAVGAALGGIAGAVLHEQCSEEDACFYEEPLPEIVGGVVFGAAIGAGLGYLIGTTKRGERWKAVALQTL